MESTPNLLEGYEGLKGRHRTDLHCTNCFKNFIVSLDYDVDGNHVVECPYCRHEHCRVIESGKVTEDRWSSRGQRVDVDPMYVWKNADGKMATSSISMFLRDRWLNRSDS